jgi:hypothetical protein
LSESGRGSDVHRLVYTAVERLSEDVTMRRTVVLLAVAVSLSACVEVMAERVGPAYEVTTVQESELLNMVELMLPLQREK